MAFKSSYKSNAPGTLSTLTFALMEVFGIILGVIALFSTIAAATITGKLMGIALIIACVFLRFAAHAKETKATLGTLAVIVLFVAGIIVYLRWSNLHR